MTYSIDKIEQWKTWPELLVAIHDLRHHLHEHPELGYEEHETTKLIRSILDAAGIAWRTCTDTGTVATINQGAAGEHIALRGDIDALPIVEQTSKTWRSKVQGKMHACGHDGHTATLMAAALWMKRYKNDLQGPVSFVFQPAEEGLHGAQKMIENGAMDGIDAIYGWHNWPAIKVGKAICPDGCVMAGNGSFGITVHGKGGHSSQPQFCKNPVLVASDIALDLQKVVERDLKSKSKVVLSVTYIDAPSGETIIPETAKLGGSIRVEDDSDRDELFRLIEQAAKKIALLYDVHVDVSCHARYGATTNHDKNADKMRTALRNVLGDEWHDDEIPVPIMASEDFSYYLNEVPGAFALIGANDGSLEHSVSCHSPHYDFNDSLIETVVEVFCKLTGAPSPK